MTETATETAAPTLESQLDALFAPWNRSDAPGFAVGVVKDGVTIYRRGFGMASLETGTAITPATRLRIGSTTKHFAALMALLLVEAGKLDLDVPIRTYLPELTGPAGDPGIRLLLQHRGGSRCHIDLGFIGHGMAIAPAGFAVQTLARQQGRNFAHGEAIIYNNGGYHLVSEAIERVGGAPLADQLKARLFDVVGMPGTALVLSDMAIVPGMATCHVPLPGGGWRRGIFPSEEVSGEGGVVSNIDDMLRWTAHLRARDRFGSAQSWDTLLETPVYADGSTGIYALGMMVDRYRGARRLHHAGGVIGGSSQMALFPDHGLDVVVLANGAPGAVPTALAESVADIVLGDALQPKPAPIDPGAYADLLGYWWSDQTGMIYALRDDAAALELALGGASSSLPLVPLADGRAVMTMGAIGDVELDLGAAKKTGHLPIRFGQATAHYVRIGTGPVDVARFSDQAQGRYHATDAATTATITNADGTLSIEFSDGLGTLHAGLELLAETVAIAREDKFGLPVQSTLSFDAADGAFTGFRLNSDRTRNLHFARL